MKLNEIMNNDPLIVKLVHQRLEKGDKVFLHDADLMGGERFEEIVVRLDHWRSGYSFVLKHPETGENRSRIFDLEDVNRLDLVKRSANTWTVIVHNDEAD